MDHENLFLAAEHRAPISLQGKVLESGVDLETRGGVRKGISALDFIIITKHEGLTIADSADKPLANAKDIFRVEDIAVHYANASPI